MPTSLATRLEQKKGGKWPKVLPPLTAEQQAISDDFMQYWHEVLPKRFGIVERFNHGMPAGEHAHDGCSQAEGQTGLYGQDRG